MPATETTHTVEKFRFPTLQGQTCVGDLYIPTTNSSTGPWPAVITGPGFAGIKEMSIPDFGKALAEAGIACLAVDFINFGESSVKVPYDVVPWDQVQTLKDGLTAFEKDPRFDSKKLGIWGASLSGGHAFVVAGTDPRVKAVVALLPHISVGGNVFDFLRLYPAIVGDCLGRVFFCRKPRVLPSIDAPGSHAVMTDPGALEWLDHVTRDCRFFANKVTYASLLRMPLYKTASYAKKITVPVLALTATQDIITPSAKIRKALVGVPSATVRDIFGTHFGALEEHADMVIELTVDWFTRVLIKGEMFPVPPKTKEVQLGKKQV